MPSLKFPIGAFIAWKTLLALFLIYGEPLIISTEHSQTLGQRLYLAWVSRWDAVFYIDIAWKGYHYPYQVFFPIFPLLIKALNLLGIPLDLAAFFLVQIFSLTCILSCYLLATKLLDENRAKKALILFICFPSTLFLNATYTEGIFLTLTLFSFYLYEQQRFILSAVIGGLASGTRLIGAAIASQYLFIKTSYQRVTGLILLALTGLIFYLLYLTITIHHPLAIIQGQQQWTRPGEQPRLLFPLEQLLTYPYEAITNTRVRNTPILFIDWEVSILFLVGGVLVWKKFGPRYGIYSLAVILIPLLSGNTMSMTRYVLAAFPVFLLGPILIKSNKIYYLLCLILFFTQLFFTSGFINNIWIG